MSTLTEIAEDHLRTHKLRGRTPVHSATRFQQITGVSDVNGVTAETLQQYRSTCQTLEYSAKTIEGSISDILMLVKIATGQSIDRGRRLPLPQSRPEPTPLASIDAIYDRCPSWVRQWLAVSFWTCLRLGDSLEFLRNRPKVFNPLEWSASKTGHRHRWPCPEWLSRHLVMQVCIPPGKTYCLLADRLRNELDLACDSVKVPRILPKHVRQRALTEWSRADATAGRVIHGCGLGVLAHYVDPLDVLETHQHRVRLPDCFGAQPVPDITTAFQRLDPDARDIVSRTIERLTG